jgi:hypothetical protein
MAPHAFSINVAVSQADRNPSGRRRSHHIGMYIKRPGGKIWHLITDLRGGRSVCGSLGVRPAFVALSASEEMTERLPLCKNCERASRDRAFAGSQPMRSPATTDSNSSSASGLSR